LCPFGPLKYDPIALFGLRDFFTVSSEERTNKGDIALDDLDPLAIIEMEEDLLARAVFVFVQNIQKAVQFTSMKKPHLAELEIQQVNLPPSAYLSNRKLVNVK
jgi:hypothetical protein